MKKFIWAAAVAAPFISGQALACGWEDIPQCSVEVWYQGDNASEYITAHRRASKARDAACHKLCRGERVCTKGAKKLTPSTASHAPVVARQRLRHRFRRYVVSLGCGTRRAGMKSFACLNFRITASIPVSASMKLSRVRLKQAMLLVTSFAMAKKPALMIAKPTPGSSSDAIVTSSARPLRRSRRERGVAGPATEAPQRG